MKTINIILVCLIILFVQTVSLYSQEKQKDIKDYTREEILNIPYDKLVEMPLEDLLILADIVGVSLDELYEMILNKDVVSASKKVESSFEAPLSTSVVSYDEIVASGARTIEEALRLVPGLIVREKTNGNFDVHIRGNDNVPPNNMFVYSENSITLVMINNRPVYNYVHGGTFWETLPIGIEDIDRIEVVRGPSSALYGPNAVSGVINIITKEPDSKKLQTTANVEYGSLKTLKAGIGIGQAISPKFGYRVTGNYFKSHRSTDLFYIVRNGDNLTVDELRDATFTDQVSGDTFFLFDPADSADLMFPDPKLAKNNYGANIYLFYNQNKNISADFSGGYQFSDIISSTMGDNATSQAGRISSTKYADVRLGIYNLKAQFNINNGWQDIVKEDTGFKVDIFNANSNIEYDLKLNKINIRPGLSYQYSQYNDLEYLHVGQGFLNGEREFSSIAGSIRIDAAPIDQLRLITAVRAEKYSTHDKMYFSYQFIGTYNINSKRLVRFVVSRANRSPFLVDSYANYLWKRDGRPNPGLIYFKGSQNLNLLTMDQYELGYRCKPFKFMQIDVEGFYSKTKNFGALYPDSINLNAFTGERPYARMAFRNIDLTSSQIGVSAALSIIVSKDLYVKLFGTIQQTQLKNVINNKLEDLLATMFATGLFNFQGDTVNRPTAYTGFPVTMTNEKNLATPSLYGGMMIDYKILEEKLHFNLNTYFMSKQSFKNKCWNYEGEEKEAAVQLSPQLNMNLKVSYTLLKGLDIYVNARNLLSTNIEFAFMDEIKPAFLGGITYNF